jgi:hypothetical protein
MAGKPLPWLMLHTTYLDDPRLGSLPENIQARFYKLYMLAHKCQQDGIITLTDSEVAFALHITEAELKNTYLQLEKSKHFKNNGRGPEIIVYKDEQRTNAQRQADRQRQAEHRNHVTAKSQPTHAIESESDIESESEIKSLSESESKATPKPTDRRYPMTKPELLTLVGIHGKYSKVLLSDPEITMDDLIAELARNYARADKVKNPGTITAMNLANRERAAPEWYTSERQAEHLPPDLARLLAIPENKQKASKPVTGIGYTKAKQKKSTKELVEEFINR